MAKRIHTYFSKFTEHPHSLGETYFAHFKNALTYGVLMILTGIAVLIHAVFPFVFVNTGSDLAKSICKDIDKRNG
jgi:hypothetical protein